MTAEALICEPIEQGKPEVVEDKIKLKELELQTQYELKYLSDSLIDLKTFVQDNKKQDEAKQALFEKKVNWITYLVLAQLAGADVPALIGLVARVGGV